MEINDPLTLDAIYDSALKCKNGVNWKPSVKYYMLHQMEKSVKITKLLQSGRWKNSKPKPLLITYPKRRNALSIPFCDRVYQRSLNDNIIYPIMTNSFIYDNAACQKGKGPDFARKRIKKFLWNYYVKYGNTGYVLQIDIRKYYDSLNHELVKKMFSDRLSYDISEKVINILDDQYRDQKGYNPGSQMIQIAGISFLDKLDHNIKEKLHEKYYVRYMDDLWILNNSKDKLCYDLKCIEKWLDEISLSCHPNKTGIRKLENGFLFLGFNIRLTHTGKVLMTIDGHNVKHEKRKLKKLSIKVKNGEITKEKYMECYTSWRSYASKGTNYKLLQKMDYYYCNSLLEE